MTRRNKRMNMMEEQIRAIQNTITSYRQQKKEATTTEQQHNCQKAIDELQLLLARLLPDHTKG